MESDTEKNLENRSVHSELEDSKAPPEVIGVSGLTKKFGAFTAVDGIELSVREHDVFGFLGPNGAGKSTTIGMILGLLRPTSGEVRLFGRPMKTQSDYREALSHVGFLMERPAFYPYLSGLDNLRVITRLKFGQTNSDAKIKETLDLVGLSDSAHKKFAAYSQGMKQRLGIALALLDKPKLVVLDEPTAGLDPAGIHEVRVLILKLAQEGITVFLSSHQLHEVEQVCSKIAVLNRGSIVAQGDVGDLLKKKTALLIKVRDEKEALAIIAGVSGVSEVHPENGYLKAEIQGRDPMETSEEISMRLSGQRIYPQEIRVEDESLEEFFLKLTATSGGSLETR